MLGEARLADGGRTPSVLQRRLLAALVVAGGAGLTVEQAQDALWPEGAPATARASLQNHVARLRERLGADAVRWDGHGYVLSHNVRTDLDAVVQVHATLAAGSTADPGERLAAVDRALALVRGPAFADLDGPAATRARRRVDDRVTDLRAARADALAALGRHAEAIAEHEALVAQDPLHEGRQAALVDARARAGRRAEAVAGYREARRLIAQRLGAEPGPLLDDAYHRAIADVRAPDGRVDDRAAALVQRPAVLAELTRRLAECPVVVLADEGAGASTLLATWTDERPGARVARVSCVDSPWEPLAALDELVAQLGVDGGIEALLAGGTWPPDAVEAVARRALARGPVTVLVDDLHAAGPTTIAAVRRLAELAPTLRLAAVARPEAADEVDVPASERWHLPPMDPDEVTSLVAARLRRRSGVAGLARWVHATTGGNPLYAIEVVEALRRDDGLRRDDDGELLAPVDVPVPERLRQLCAARLTAFGRRTRRALDVLAVLGEEAGDELLAALRVDPADLAAAEGAGVVVHGDHGWRFTHEVLRHAARASVPAGLAVELTLAAAAHLEARGGPPARVAEQRLAAVEVDPVGAARACEAAASAAVSGMAFGEAAGWADRGLEALAAATSAPTDLQGRLAVLAADGRRRGGVPGHGPRLLAAVQQVVDDPDPSLRRRAVVAALRLGECCQPGTSQAHAVALADAVLAREDAGDHVAVAPVLAARSLTWSMVDAARARADVEAALRHLDAAPAADRDALALEVLPYAYLGVGRPEDLELRERLTRRLEQAAEAEGDAEGAMEAAHLAFSCAVQRGDLPAMRSALARQVELEPVAADAGRRWQVAYQRAALAQVEGDLDAAEHHAAAALDLGRLVAPQRAMAAWAGQLLELRRQQDRLGELRPVVDGLLADPDALPAWRAAGALVLAVTGDPGASALVDELVADVGAFPDDFVLGGTLVTLGRAAALVADAEARRVLARRLEPLADRWSWQGTTTYGRFADVVDELGERGSPPERTRTS